MRRILAVEDNREMQILIESSLSDLNVVFSTSIGEAKMQLSQSLFDLMLLDLSLPDGDGLRFLADLHSEPKTKNLPVIILSGRSETVHKVTAFTIGAEDYVSKPFDPIELKARVEARLRRLEQASSQNELMVFGDLKIDRLKQKVFRVHDKTKKETDLELTTLEFKLLVTLARSPEQVFSRSRLLDEVWGHNVSITDRTVDTHIGHLRKKLTVAHNKTDTYQIETVVGAGYRFTSDPH